MLTTDIFEKTNGKIVIINERVYELMKKTRNKTRSRPSERPRKQRSRKKELNIAKNDDNV